MSRTSLRETSLGRSRAHVPTPRAAHGIDTGSTWRVVAALARLEGRKLLRHPVFLAGLGFALLGSAFFVAEAVRKPEVSWAEDGWTVFVGAGMLGLLTMVAADYATLRDRREHTEEQHDSLPAGEPAKTGALLLGTLWPAFVSAVLLAAVAGYAATMTRIESYEAFQLVERLVVVVMFGSLGVAIARWIPNPFVAPLAAWGFIFLAPPESPSNWHVLSPLVAIDSLELATWHVAYVIGLTAFFGAAALLRHRPRFYFVVAGMLGLALASVSLGFLLPQVCATPGRCLF
ncbi:MAG: hypothetical protein M3124_09965 [Actinomycetota bacterium]|nr:hypothetical protein [Actinomycetota bacterium]